MQTDPTSNHIELKINRDFGGIVSAYFDFLKQNIKKFTNIFLSYNGIFLVGLLIASYLLVSGFVGQIRSEQANTGFNSDGGTDESHLVLIGAGGILFLIIFLIVAILNYSLSGSYMMKYESEKGNHFDKKEVWQMVKDRLGQVLVFILLLVPIYLLFMVVYFIVALIPLIGLFGNLFGQYLLAAWIGVSFFSLLEENKGVSTAFGEGWRLVTKNFWQSIGVNFVLGLLNGILLLMVMIIPGILVGIYSYHVVQNEVDVTQSIVPTIIYTLALCCFLILAVYSQCLKQFVNGILYYALHEKTYNTNTRSKIDQIGNLD